MAVKSTKVKSTKVKSTKVKSTKVKSAKVKKKGKRLCTICGRAIPLARLKILPGTTTCVRCATVERYSSLDVPDFAFAQPPDGARIEDEEES